MLAIGCPDRHSLPLIHSPPPPKTHRPRRAESRESGFVRCPFSAICPLPPDRFSRVEKRTFVLLRRESLGEATRVCRCRIYSEGRPSANGALPTCRKDLVLTTENG